MLDLIGRYVWVEVELRGKMEDKGHKVLQFENTYLSQVGILGIQLLWTKRSEEALKNARYDRKVMYYGCGGSEVGISDI